MRCVYQIRADRVAPVPVADACLHSQQRTAETCLPPFQNDQRWALTRVYKAQKASDEAITVRSCGERLISLKTRGAWGRAPCISGA
jgi:hypothetical protein